MDASEVWKDVFQNLKSNADVYLGSDKIRQVYKNPGLSISFSVDDLDHRINACIRKSGSSNYDIRILAGLVGALEQHGNEVIHSCPILFSDLDRTDEKRIGIAHSYLLYLWLDFIFCHEWAHALCGHLDFDSRINEWYEFENEEFPAKEIENQISQRLEAEADSVAAKFSLARFSTYWEGLTKELSPNPTGKRALRDYVIAMLLLFKFFEELRARAEKSKNTHPIPFNRAFIFLAFCLGEYSNIPGLPVLSSEDKDLLFGVAAVEFYVKVLGIDPTQYLIKSIEAAKFTESVGRTIESLGMNKYRIYAGKKINVNGKNEGKHA